MSGRVCLIIIQGNLAQANTRFATRYLSNSDVLKAQQLIGAFESLCELGTTSYDGEEVMTDPQQAQAVSLMGAYNTAIEPLLAVHGQPSFQTIAGLVSNTLSSANALLDAVVANP